MLLSSAQHHKLSKLLRAKAAKEQDPARRKALKERANSFLVLAKATLKNPRTKSARP